MGQVHSLSIDERSAQANFPALRLGGNNLHKVSEGGLKNKGELEERFEKSPMVASRKEVPSSSKECMEKTLWSLSPT